MFRARPLRSLRSRWAALAAALATLTPGPARALPPEIPLRSLVRDTFHDRDGLPQNAVRTLLHAGSGELWVGTDEGIGRYDGATWAHLDRRSAPGLTSNIITAQAETPDGMLWVGTYDGGLLRRRAGRFEPVDLPNAPAGLRVTALAVDPGGGLWVGSAAGLYHLAGDRVEALTMASGLPDDRVSALLAARDGTLWVSARRGVVRVVGGKVEPGPRELEGVSVTCFGLDPAGGLWVGTADRGVIHLGADGVRLVGTAQGLPSPSVSALVVDRDGSLWIGLQRAGLARLRGGTIERLSTRDGLAGDWISALLEDREGSIWAATQDAGLIRLRRADFQTIGAAEGLSHDAVESLLQVRSGDLWVATDGGVDVLPRGALPARRVLPGAPMALLEDRDGAVWIGTIGHGLWRWRDGAVTRLEAGLPANTWFRALAEDAEGTIWAATTTGLYRVRGARLEPVDEGLPPERPEAVALAVTASGLFVATDGGGIFRRGGGRFVREDSGPPDTWVATGFHADGDGTLWIATMGGGLWRRRGGSYAQVTTAQGLHADTLWTILDDGADGLWLSSNRGIARVARADLEAVMDGRAVRLQPRTWSMDDGLRSQEASGLSQPGGWRGADGRLWFGTLRGLSVVDPARLGRIPPPPESAFHAVTAGAEPRALTGLVTLGPRDRRLELEYGARTLLAQRRATFRYRLAGLEDGWSEPTASGTTHYTYLPPGAYRFEVQARLDEGAWGPVAALEIRQQPAAWRSPAALAGAAAALLGGAALLAGAWRRRAAARQARAGAALREAQGEVAALSALAPRCGWCREERRDAAYLAEVDAAMRARPASQFDGARCPACAAQRAGERPVDG